MRPTNNEWLMNDEFPISLIPDILGLYNKTFFPNEKQTYIAKIFPQKEQSETPLPSADDSDIWVTLKSMGMVWVFIAKWVGVALPDCSPARGGPKKSSNHDTGVLHKLF
jgi:hypothetical protein